MEIVEPMKLFCDNKVAINISHNLVQYDTTKHVKIDRHFIKEKIEVGIVCTPYIPTKLQLVDLFSKGIAGPSSKSMASKLSMQEIFEPA